MIKQKIIMPLIILLVAFIAIFMYLNFSRGRVINQPESITFDSTGKRFLISNIKGKSIATMTLDGKYGILLKDGLTSPRGIMAKDNYLYVADATQLKIIDIPTAKISKSIIIPDARMLNDLALDKTGLVYITDTAANCVFVVDTIANTTEKIQSSLLKAPNGIVYDMPRDQMLIVGFSKRSPILSLNTLGRNVSIFMDTIYSDLDGIAIDDLGRIYISSWAQDMIFMIPQEQNRFVAKFKDIKDAADIFYYLPTNELIVPLVSKSKIIRIPLE